MALYTLSFDIMGVFGGSVPKLSIIYGGTKIGMSYAYAGSNTLSFQIDTDNQPFDHTLLRFYFVKSSGISGDNIDLSNIQIDGNALDTTNFTTNTGGSVSSGTVSLSKGGYSDYDAGTDLPDTQIGAPSAGGGALATITGTTGDDIKLYGTNEAGGDVIDALAGNDYVIAGGGDDLVYGRDGDDKIVGGDGNDTLNGDAGNDYIAGGNGNDTVNGGDDDDRIYGNAGDDTLNGDAGNDRIYGGDGIDTISGGTGNDIIGGHAGNDIINGDDGADRLYGNDGNDTIRGGNDNDQIRGGDGGDFLYGDAGDDNLDGQNGDDRLEGGLGIDNLSGDDGNDTLLGDDGDDTLNGGQGADVLYGGNGNDIIHGGGIDSYDQYTIRVAGGGTSNIYFSEQTQSFYQIVTTNVDFATAEAAAQAATLNGAAGHLVTITSQIENDFVSNFISDNSWTSAQDLNQDGTWEWTGGVEAYMQFSDINGNSVNNAYENWAVGQPQNNTEYNGVLYTTGEWHDWAGTATHSYVIEWDASDVMADNSDDFLYGDAGNDILYGGEGNDRLEGGADNDILHGGKGNDTILGDAGDDVLYASRAGYLSGEVTVADILAANPTLSYNATTGNFYEYVDSGSISVTHAEALTFAASNIINGVASHLATLADAAEQTFIGDLVNSGDYAWIDGSDSASEGTFVWESGPEAGTGLSGTLNWWGGAGPNPNSNNADNIIIWDGGGDVLYVFRDTNNTHGYVAEWEGSSLLSSGTFLGYDSSGETNSLFGGAGNDTLYGAMGNDTLDGGADNDILYGDNGNDTLDGGAGNDTLDGGAGTDVVTFAAASGAVTVDLSAGTATGYGTDTLTNIENVTGSAFNDIITGDGNANTLIGGAGNDTITSGAGNDIISGGDGNDILASTSASSGVTVADILAANPTVTYDATTGNFYEFVLVNINYSSAVTSVAGRGLNGIGGHLATITSASEDATVGGLVNGSDYGWIALDDSAVEGTFLWNAGPEAGTGTGSWTNWFGGGGPNPNSGGADNTLYLGDSWSDVWYVWAGTNTARGYVAEWEGVDVLSNVANLTTDTVTLSGGDGLDTLYGGAGIDTFVFEAASAYNDSDQIENFSLGAGGDALDISDLLSGFSGPITDWVNFVDSGGNTLIQVDSNGTSGGASFTTIGQINGVTGLDEATLYADGNIIV